MGRTRSYRFGAADRRRKDILRYLVVGPVGGVIEPSLEGAAIFVSDAATARSGALVEYVVLDAADGQAEGWISRFDVDVWLVASPLNDTVALQPFTWTAALGEASAPMEGAVVLDPDRAGDPAVDGCGCRLGGTQGGLAALVVLGLALRRRAATPAAGVRQ